MYFKSYEQNIGQNYSNEINNGSYKNVKDFRYFGKALTYFLTFLLQYLLPFSVEQSP